MNQIATSALTIVALDIGILGTYRLGRDMFNVTRQRHADRIFRRRSAGHTGVLVLTAVTDVVLFTFLAYNLVALWKFSALLMAGMSPVLLGVNFADGWMTTARQSAFWRYDGNACWPINWAYHLAATIDVAVLIMVGYLFILTLL